jgi:hypothetical protein
MTSDEEMIILARQHTRDAVLALVEIARQSEDDSAKQTAISLLRDRGFLASSDSINDGLLRIKKMNDEEIHAVFRRAMN